MHGAWLLAAIERGVQLGREDIVDLPVQGGVDGVLGNHRQGLVIFLVVVLEHVGEVVHQLQAAAILAIQRKGQITLNPLDDGLAGIHPLVDLRCTDHDGGAIVHLGVDLVLVVVLEVAQAGIQTVVVGVGKAQLFVDADFCFQIRVADDVATCTQIGRADRAAIATGVVQVVLVGLVQVRRLERPRNTALDLPAVIDLVAGIQAGAPVVAGLAVVVETHTGSQDQVLDGLKVVFNEQGKVLRIRFAAAFASASDQTANIVATRASALCHGCGVIELFVAVLETAGQHVGSAAQFERGVDFTCQEIVAQFGRDFVVTAGDRAFWATCQTDWVLPAAGVFILEQQP